MFLQELVISFSFPWGLSRISGDCDSQHVPVVAICEPKLKNIERARTKNVYDYDKMGTESLQVNMKEMQTKESQQSDQK